MFMIYILYEEKWMCESKHDTLRRVAWPWRVGRGAIPIGDTIMIMFIYRKLVWCGSDV
jgi:hypothetical protein